MYQSTRFVRVLNVFYSTRPCGIANADRCIEASTWSVVGNITIMLGRHSEKCGGVYLVCVCVCVHVHPTYKMGHATHGVHQPTHTQLPYFIIEQPKLFQA
jgi:hypothetical protein